MGTDTLKYCGCCDTTKSVTEFGIKTGSPTGYQDWCLECNRENNRKQRMFVNGQYVSKKHPMWKPGRFTMLDASFFFMAEEEEKTTPEGYVYIITNPAWPECVKVGMAKSPDGRLGGFQTYSPYRDYEAYHVFHCKDYAKAEQKAHKIMESKFTRAQGEWFLCSAADALKTLEGKLK